MSGNTISVVIPTRNRQKELLRAIDSVKAQSQPPDEIIVVDDKSDFSVSWSLSKRYGPTIRIISNERNLGASESRNIGARAAIGEYIAFLDSDDSWHPDKLSKQLEVFQKSTSVGLVYCNQWIVAVDGHKTAFRNELIDTHLWDYLLQGWTAPNTSTLVFRRSVFMDLGGFDSRLRSCQDHDLWMRMAIARIPVAYSPERLSYVLEGAPFKITHDYENRLHGMEMFLAKWEDTIVRSHGRKHYSEFKTAYINKVALPLAKRALRQHDYACAIALIARYLAFNHATYKRIISRMSRDLKRWTGNTRHRT